MTVDDRVNEANIFFLHFTSPRFTNPPFTSPRFKSPCFTSPRFTSPVQSGPQHTVCQILCEKQFRIFFTDLSKSDGKTKGWK